MARRATAEEVRAICTEEELGSWLKTDEIEPLESIIGQERAVKALEFGLEIEDQGFNIFVAGLPGTGRTTAVKNFLENIAKTKPTPSDWCYVYNFRDPYTPRAIELPAGKGVEFARDMKNFIASARREIPRAFESEEYAKKREETIETFNAQRNRLFQELNERASEAGFMIQPTPTGLFIIPVIDGEPIKDKDFAALPREQQEEIIRRREELEAEVASTFRELQNIERMAHEAIRELDRQVADYVLGLLLKDMREKYRSLPAVLNYLEAVKADILDNLALFRGRAEGERPGPPWHREDPFRRYEVNVLVDNSELQGAPVIVEYNPTYSNLVGRIEREAVFGALITDFTMIRPGALHRANGGYLIIPVEEMVRNLFSWDGLKRALREGRVVIEDISERLGLLTTKTLQPEPIPLKLKVILLGDPWLYYIFFHYDPDFQELFKVKAEFGTRMDRTPENVRKYAAFFRTLCEKENLLHLDASAVAKLVEYGSRLAEDQTKLATRFSEIADVVREACYYARKEGAAYVSACHVRQAIDARFYRSNLIQERIQEMITRGFIKIEVTGAKVGQVNGLAVIDLGDISFGRPQRITATVAAGKEGVIDIEREARLGGRIHTKGVLILTGYLNEKYYREAPLSLAARLVFEQNYEGVEGDSASSAELYALLSALSGLPIKQNLAVTGSVNQKGEIQAVGGINEKIEGFFDICKAKGLTGDQGVIIPSANKENLMLREDVVEAIKQGLFHIYFVNTVDEGIELLTGVPAGERGPDGKFPPDTVHGRVAARLREMAEQINNLEEEEGEGIPEEDGNGEEDGETDSAED
ncbi:Lon protease family protein [Ammonifex thiophilus]|uniref:endopeptidase La n=1 Tax=Ammonifex thiophilus TaxID=444093 RepID=A0A3D8P521_9THEO|nr:ATP-binding protein [Ammonifex thiophilus]RDV84316.1 ATP-binding protein [Ammonifex thiophilus]